MAANDADGSQEKRKGKQVSVSTGNVEAAREGVEQHPPMTFKRLMAIFSLGCLLAVAQIPLYLIGGALG